MGEISLATGRFKGFIFPAFTPLSPFDGFKIEFFCVRRTRRLESRVHPLQVAQEQQISPLESLDRNRFARQALFRRTTAPMQTANWFPGRPALKDLFWRAKRSIRIMLNLGRAATDLNVWALET